MQQPPLSIQIKTIETQLDLRLFRRKPRGVELTDAGQTLLAEARAILAHLDRAIEATRRTARGEQGRLCIGIAPTAPFHWLVPRSIRNFRKAFPQVALTLEEGLSNDVVGPLTSQRMDIAFVRNAAIRTEGLTTQALLEEPMILALASHHPLARRRQKAPVDLSKLVDDPFILIGPPGTGLHDEAVAACLEAGFSPSIGQQAPRITSTLGLVAAGLGVALLPECLKTVKMDGVSYRYVRGPRQPRAFLGLALRKGDQSPAVVHFIAAVKSTLRARGAGQA
jgi:DNA-binding transcriptional LysR family regulator